MLNNKKTLRILAFVICNTTSLIPMYGESQKKDAQEQQ